MAPIDSSYWKICASCSGNPQDCPDCYGGGIKRISEAIEAEQLANKKLEGEIKQLRRRVAELEKARK